MAYRALQAALNPTCTPEHHCSSLPSVTEDGEAMQSRYASSIKFRTGLFQIIYGSI